MLQERFKDRVERLRLPMKQRTFPFQPKSTSYLLPGDFWAIPLCDGSFACGRVIQLKVHSDGTTDSRRFLAGLLDWFGSVPPSESAISGRRTLIQGQAHVLTIQKSGGFILGYRPLASDGIEPALLLSHAAGPGVLLQRGFSVLRPASEQERTSLPVFFTFGYAAMARRAEAHLATA